MRLCKPEFNTELGKTTELGGEEAAAGEGSLVLAVTYKGQDSSRVWAITPGPGLYLELCVETGSSDSWNLSFQIVAEIVVPLGTQYCVVFWESVSRTKPGQNLLYKDSEFT